MKSDLGSTKLRLRKALSEHPFGTLKYWMGYIPILLPGKQKVQIEMDIYTIAYNFKRMLNLTSFDQLKELIEKKRMSAVVA